MRVTFKKGPNKLGFSRLAWNKQAALVNKYSTEVGWYGIGRVEGHLILVEDIYVPEQKVHATRVELAPEVVPNNVLWGHSHVNMACTPSSQDNETWDEFMNTPEVLGDINYAMLIINKRGETFSRLGTRAYEIENPTITIIDDGMEDFLAEVDSKIKPLHTQNYQHFAGKYKNNGFGW